MDNLHKSNIKLLYKFSMIWYVKYIANCIYLSFYEQLLHVVKQFLPLSNDCAIHMASKNLLCDILDNYSSLLRRILEN